MFSRIFPLVFVAFSASAALAQTTSGNQLFAENPAEVACQELSLNAETVKTCLAYKRSEAVVRGCAEMFLDDSRRLACIGYNRSLALLSACSGFSLSETTKLSCLGYDAPPNTVSACRQTRGESWKLDCLHGVYRNPVQFRRNF